VAANGNTVYSAFERWTGTDANGDRMAEIVVVRDDFGVSGTGPTNDKFMDLGFNGVIVATPTIPESLPAGAMGTALGLERLGSDLSIAVNPSNDQELCVSYAEVAAMIPRVRTSCSMNGGAAWAPVPTLDGLNNSALPALAYAANGSVGLLYAHLDNKGTVAAADDEIDIRFVQSPAGFGSSVDSLIMYFPQAEVPKGPGDPYIGDYFDLEVLGDTFYGTFSAGNNPDPVRFPNANSVIFQRFVDYGAGTVANSDLITQGMAGDLDDGAGNMVALSIDPWFFTTSVVPEPSCALAFVVGILILGCLHGARFRS
jgi:hypothetical protein